MSEPQSRDIVKLLRQADLKLHQHPLRPPSEARLRQLVYGGEAQPKRGFQGLWLAAACGTCAAISALVWINGQRHAAPPSQRAVQLIASSRQGAPEVRIAGFAVLEGKPEQTLDRQLRCPNGSCRLTMRKGQASLKMARSARILRRDRDVAIIAGRVECTLKKDAGRKDPWHVYVSHGQIKVTGTRFTVVQGQASGSVTLHRGQISYLDKGGQTIVLSAGQTLRWPLSDERLAQASHPSSHRSTGRLGARATEALLLRVEQLRSQGRYQSAVRQLRAALPHVQHKVTRERLHYEVGTLLSMHMHDRRAACQHWNKHLAQFGKRRYGAEIGKLRRELRCR
ncbi:MAG: FecR domain-containing protein [Deltaproteobacteria bacterium]|nr:FecR domain-containing protein [Deltaproteobacteria bacterium]